MPCYSAPRRYAYRGVHLIGPSATHNTKEYDMAYKIVSFDKLMQHLNLQRERGDIECVYELADFSDNGACHTHRIATR